RSAEQGEARRTRKSMIFEYLARLCRGIWHDEGERKEEAFGNTGNQSRKSKSRDDIGCRYMYRGL
ncbi:MAG: hypothetical protein ACOCM4_08145, partial [Acetivibrio ethanolgignens]